MTTPGDEAQTLSAFLASSARRAPAEPALIAGDRLLSFADLLDDSRRVAAGLARIGVGPDDMVAIWLQNTPEWLTTAFAAARLGARVLALNPRFRSAELDDLLPRSRAKVLVLDPDAAGTVTHGEIIADCEAGSLDAIEAVVRVGGGTRPLAHRHRVVRYAELLRNQPHVGDLAASESPWVVFTTSGTTNRPKFVVHTHRSILRHAAASAAAFGYGAPGTVLLQVLPLSGTFGLAQAMAALAAGRPSVLQPVFVAEAAAALIARHRVTDFNGSDEMVARLLDAAAGPEPFPTLHGCGYAAFSPALANLVEQGERRGLCLFGLYGSSEAQALFARQPLDAASAARARPGGFPVSPDAAFRIRDPASGAVLPAGESGELELKGPSLMLGYIGDASATQRAFTEDGWFRTGDLAHGAADGSFVFEARMGDVLRLGGYLVAPEEIETYLRRHPSVEACQVVDTEVAGRVRAVGFLKLRPGAELAPEELRAFCARGLARYKVPAEFIALDCFPTTQSANGAKVQRGRLRQMAAARITGEPG